MQNNQNDGIGEFNDPEHIDDEDYGDEFLDLGELQEDLKLDQGPSNFLNPNREQKEQKAVQNNEVEGGIDDMMAELQGLEGFDEQVPSDRPVMDQFTGVHSFKMDDLNKIISSEDIEDPVQNNTDIVQIGSNLQEPPDQILQTTSNIQNTSLEEGIPLSSFLENRLYEEDEKMDQVQKQKKPAIASIPANLAKNKRYGAFEDDDEEVFQDDDQEQVPPQTVQKSEAKEVIGEQIELDDQWMLEDNDSDEDNYQDDDFAPMPIVDNGYDDDNELEVDDPIQSVDGPDFSKMTGLDQDGKIKDLKMNQKGKKEIDLRKGIQIEKNSKQRPQSGKPQNDFDIIQHSQSHFEGVKGYLIQKAPSDSSFKSNAALQSFANVGGTSHIMNTPETEKGSNSVSHNLGGDGVLFSFTPPSDVSSKWHTSSNFERWVIQEGQPPLDENIMPVIKPKQEEVAPPPKKKKLNKADFMFKGLSDQKLVKMPGDINGIDFMIKDLDNCQVFLLDHTAQIQVDRCKNTKFFIGPVKASIFFRDCQNCEITVSCSQFRCRNLTDTTIKLYTPNDPIIESSANLTFAPYNFKYGLLEYHSEQADITGTFTDEDNKLQTKYNKWNQIFDFTKREDGQLNYQLLNPSQFQIYQCDIEVPKNDQDSDFLFELPKEFGGNLDSSKIVSANTGGMLSFDIKTGAQEAQKQLIENDTTQVQIEESLNEAQMFKSVKDQTLVKRPGEVNGQDFMIQDLENCKVIILDHSAQIQVDRCKNTEFFIGPNKAEILIKDCSNCKISVSTTQFRCKNLEDTVIHLYSPNDPIIESSKGLLFAPYNFKYPNLKQHATEALLIDKEDKPQIKENKWKQNDHGVLELDQFQIVDLKDMNLSNFELGNDNQSEWIFDLPLNYQSPKQVQAVSNAPPKKKKLNKADFMFKSQKDQILIKNPGDINGIDFMIKDLENCTVILMDHTAQIQVDRCKNTKFFIGPIKASIFVRNCDQCEITVSCSQFRCRELTNSLVNVYTPNDPIVESSEGLKFAPYNLKYPLLKEHSLAADIIGEFTDDDGIVQKKINKWNQIFDFTKREDGQLNYSLIEKSEFKLQSISDIEPSLQINKGEEPDFMFELPIEFGGSLSSNQIKAADSMMAFDIKTGAQAAQQQFDLKNSEEQQKQDDQTKEIKQENKDQVALPKKKKLNKADFMFKSQQDQMLVKKPGDINGIDFMIKDLDNCVVMLLDHTAQIQVDRCKNTKFFIGPVKASIFIRNCDSCEITVCCSQFRCRELTNSRVNVFTPNDPIVESSSDLIFAPYNFKYPLLHEHSLAADIVGEFTDDDGIVQKKINKWNLIFDFTKREDGILNYTLMQPEKFIVSTYKEINESLDVTCGENPDFLFELPVEFGGTLASNEVKTADSMMAFDIKTGAQAAQEQFDQRQQEAMPEPQPEQTQQPAEEKKEPAAPPKKKKLNKADFMFKSLQDQTLVKLPGDINGIDFMIKDLENCTVMLLDHTAQIQVDRCKNTRFFIGPVKASIFVRNCDSCEVTVCCSQFRCRELTNSTVNVYTPNDPIVESSSGLTFAPYNFRYPLLHEHSLAADLVGEFTDDDGVVQKKVNKWNLIFDFTKREDGQLNYSFVSPDKFAATDYIEMKPDLEISPGADPQFLFELPVEFGGTLATNKTQVADSLMAFDIKTGAQAAQSQFDQQRPPAGPDEVTKPLDLPPIPFSHTKTEPQQEQTQQPAEEKKEPAAPPKKKKLNKADFMFKSLQDQTLVKLPGDINGIDFMIKDLENCTVMLLDHTAQIQVDRCKNTRFFIGPVKASIFVRNCDSCEVTVSCSQFRCRELTNSTVNVYTPNDPIVESSSGLTFAPYNFRYPLLHEHSLAADLVGEFTDDDGVVQKKVNKWNLIFDFTKREDGQLNYSFVSPDKFAATDYTEVKPDLEISPGADPHFLFELPVEFGGTLASNETKVADSLMAFDIKTGAQAAQSQFDQQRPPAGPDEVTKPLDLPPIPFSHTKTEPQQEQTQQPAEEKKEPAAPPKKKKLNKADFMFKSLQDQTLVKLPGDINGIDFMIKDLENCTVMLLDHTAQIQVDRCKNTRFFIGPVKASIFVRNCDSCEVTVSCSQFRCRELTNSTVNVYTPNDPIVESSSGLIFAPYNFKYPLLHDHSIAADIVGQFTDDDGVVQKKINKWNLIFDFTKREDSQLNYQLIKPDEFKFINHKDINSNLNIEAGENPDFLFELPVEFGGTLASNEVKTADSMMAFDIKTGAQAAQEQFDQRQQEAMPEPQPEQTQQPAEEKKEPAAPPKKKKLNKADFMFKSLQDQTLVKLPGDINGIDFMIKDLENCTVMLLDHTAQIQVDRCKNTRFFIGPVKASIFVRNCDSCEVTVCCSQFRCRELTNSTVNVYTPNDPIVESSSGLTFAPYNFRYPLLHEHSLAADLVGEFTDDDGVVQKKVNKWNLIFDFTKREDGQLNYSFVSPDKFAATDYTEVKPDLEISPGADPQFLFELPIEFGGTLASNETKVADSLMAFDIKTGAQAAQSQFDQQRPPAGPDEVTKPLDLPPIPFSHTKMEPQPEQTQQPAEEKKEPAAPPKKKKLNKADFMFKSLQDQTLVKLPGDINGIDFMIKDLENCTVMLLDHTAQIQVDRCKNTRFFIGPVKASIFVRNCDSCEVTVCCSQFRCRELTNSTVNVYTPNDPIVESSSGLTFAPYNFRYPLLHEHSLAADLVGEFTDDDGVVQKKVNKWNLIFDFTKREDGQLNYSFVSPDKFAATDYTEVKPDLEISPGADPQFLFELPIEFGGTLASNETKVADSLMAFDIKTGAQAAQSQFDQQRPPAGPDEVTKLDLDAQTIAQDQNIPEKKLQVDPIDDMFGMRTDSPKEEKKKEAMKSLIIPGKKLVIKNFKKPSAGPLELSNAQSKAKFLLKNFKNVGKSSALDPNAFYGSNTVNATSSPDKKPADPYRSLSANPKKLLRLKSSKLRGSSNFEGKISQNLKDIPALQKNNFLLGQGQKDASQNPYQDQTQSHNPQNRLSLVSSESNPDMKATPITIKKKIKIKLKKQVIKTTSSNNLDV